MLTSLAITTLIILIYFLYPFWLLLLKKDKYNEEDIEVVDGVSIIYLSQNGENNIKKKIEFLLSELESFEKSEILVIDDASTDSSDTILSELKSEKLRVYKKFEAKGIPDSMNFGVNNARYPVIVFCDQRQQLPQYIVRKLIEPLKYNNIGAVSSCIANVDKSSNFSF